MFGWLAALGFLVPASVLALAVFPGEAFAQDWSLTMMRGGSMVRPRGMNTMRSTGAMTRRTMAGTRMTGTRMGNPRPRMGRSTGTDPASTRAERPNRNPPNGLANDPGADADRNTVLIERYHGILEANPAEGFAFDRLLDLYRERDGNIDAFVTWLEGRRAAEPQAFAPPMMLGHIYKAQGRLADAERSYEAALALRPNAVPALESLGAIARSQNDHAEARARYEQALSHINEPAAQQELLRQLGEIALDQNDLDGAGEYYARIGRQARGSVYLLTEFARALTSRGQHERAVAEYQRVLGALRGDNRVLAPVLRELGMAQRDAGSLDDAIASLDRALRLSGPSAGVRAEIYDSLADVYRRADRLPDLIDRLTREGASFDTQKLLGELNDELGNEDEALAAYRRALGRNGRDIDTRVRIIRLLSRSGRIDDMIGEYEGLIRIAPREPQFVVELATLLMQVGRRDDALRKAAEISRRHPREPAVHQALAELYANWGEEELSTREMATLARIEPNDPAHLVALGAQQLEAGDRSQALSTWRRILTVETDRALAHATLGGVYSDYDMLEEAAQEYEAAVRAEGDNMEYVRGLATVYERLRRDDDAIGQWQDALRLSGDDRPSRREARRRIVAIWARTNRLPERIRGFEQQFRADPPNIEAGRFLAEAHRRMGAAHMDQAETVLTRVIELDPGDVESLLVLERVKTAKGDLAGAIEVLQRLAEADPRRAPRYLQRMAEHALALYRDEDAVRYAAQAVDRLPDDANAHRRLGDLYRARQDMPAAIASYRRAIELNDRLHPTYFELAELHLSRGELTEADRLYREVVRASPDDDLVARAARASMQIHLGQGTLEQLENDLLPLALGHPQRPVFRKLVVELYDALATPLIQVARQTGRGSQATEAQAAEAELRRIGSRSIKPLLEALADSEPAQQRVAVDILGYLGNENAAAPLMAAAESDGDMALRIRALAAAGALGAEELAPRFVALATGRERRLRALAAWALARTGGAEGVRSMRTLLRDGDTSVRAFAALGLGRAGDAASAATLERLLREDVRGHVQVAAAWSLGELGDADHVPALLAALRGRQGMTAVAAATALGKIGAPTSRDGLAHALFHSDPRVRRSAATALRRIGATGELPSTRFPVPMGVVSPSSYVRALVETEQEVETEGDLAPLRDSLRTAAADALRGPVEKAMVALEVLDGADNAHVGFAPLTQGLAGWSEEAQARTRQVLQGIGTDLIDDLVEASRHPNPAVRALAVRVVARVGHPAAAAAQIEALNDSDAAVQRAVLENIGLHHAAGLDAAVPTIASVLDSQKPWAVRTLAAETLGRLGNPRAVPALVTALGQDEYAFVREAAARSLGRLGGAEARQALERACDNDSEAEVRAAAQAALAGP
ncbi:MAG: HEAT repeat domain-containing protein [Myxococcota bacterium]